MAPLRALQFAPRVPSADDASAGDALMIVVWVAGTLIFLILVRFVLVWFIDNCCSFGGASLHPFSRERPEDSEEVEWNSGDVETGPVSETAREVEEVLMTLSGEERIKLLKLTLALQPVTEEQLREWKSSQQPNEPVSDDCSTDTQDDPSLVCSICIQNYVTGELLVNTSCDHRFHASCLGEWVKKHDSCPYCRTCLFKSEDVDRFISTERPETCIERDADSR